MNTVELFHRIGRRGREGDFTKFSLAEQGDVMESVNSAMQQVYNALPSYFKEQSEGFVLPAPRNLVVAVTQYSNMLSSDVFDESEIGRTVVLDGDPAWNQVLDTNQLLNPYMGTTVAQVSGQVYGNAIFSEQYPFDRIIGNPRLANQNTAFWNKELIRVQPSGIPWLFQQGIGQPQVWWVEFQGNAQGYEPLLVLRVAPAPSVAMSINVRLSFWPRRLTMQDYTAATTIPVPDQFIDSCLIPIATRTFMASPAYVKRGDEDRIDARAVAAELTLKNQPGQPAAPNNRVFTPLGY